MLVFFGLGNNEEKYLKTKHNAGRILLESVAENLNLDFKKGDGYFFAKGKFGNDEAYFLYSSGYMNNSGSVLSKFMKYFKIDPLEEDFNLIILHDDSDQIEGRQKLSQGGGSAGHNGIQDIYNHSLSLNLPIEKIWRLKIGIRPKNNTQKSETFVLKNMGSEEIKRLNKLGGLTVQKQVWFASGDFQKLQTIFNSEGLD